MKTVNFDNLILEHLGNFVEILLTQITLKISLKKNSRKKHIFNKLAFSKLAIYFYQLTAVFQIKFSHRVRIITEIEQCASKTKISIHPF